MASNDSSLLCFVVLVASALVATCRSQVGSQEVCYDSLGCFSTGLPFNASGRNALLPESPQQIGTRFMLFTRKNKDTPDVLVADDDVTYGRSHFNPKHPTKVITHGWGDASNPWYYKMASEFLIAEDCNAIVVIWEENGLRGYAQSAANCRVVGAQIAQMVNFLLKQSKKITLKDFHILGHSMGAHIAGYAGERLPGLSRITGIDSAEPMFQYFAPEVRLDEKDADFVDAIHTDSDGGVGTWQPSGHVDIYPNGGSHQPGCDGKRLLGLMFELGRVEGVRNYFSCNHIRGYEYAIEAVTSSCPWRAYRCDGGWEEFKTGRCLRCPSGKQSSSHCNSMVSRAAKPTDGSVNNIFWLSTASKKPYCRYHFHVQLTTSNIATNEQQNGNIWVKLIDKHTSTDFLQLNREPIVVNPGKTYDFLVLSNKAIKSVTSVEVKWESVGEDATFYTAVRSNQSSSSSSIHLKSVNIFSGEFQDEHLFCDGSAQGIETSTTRLYTKQSKKC